MNGKKICVTIAGVTKEYPISSTTFEAAHKYTYTIKVKKTGLQVSSTIGDWTDGGDNSSQTDAEKTLTY